MTSHSLCPTWASCPNNTPPQWGIGALGHRNIFTTHVHAVNIAGHRLSVHPLGDPPPGRPPYGPPKNTHICWGIGGLGDRNSHPLSSDWSSSENTHYTWRIGGLEDRMLLAGGRITLPPTAFGWTEGPPSGSMCDPVGVGQPWLARVSVLAENVTPSTHFLPPRSRRKAL